MLSHLRRAYSVRVIPSRTLVRGHPTRNSTGTLLRAAFDPIHPQTPHCQGTSAPYSTVVTEEALPTKKKVWDSVDEAVADVKSGDVLLSGGTYYCLSS